METKRDGLTMESAFIITDSSGEMTSSIANFVDQMFGGGDGSYFIHSETTVPNRENGKRYKVLFVETESGSRIKVFFELP